MPAKEAGWAIDEYTTQGGQSPIRTFMAGLTDRDKVDAIALIKLLQERGNALRRPQSAVLGKGLFELRSNQVRIFYMFRHGRRITLLDGILKKKDKIPAKTLERVRRFQQEIMARHKKMERGT